VTLTGPAVGKDHAAIAADIEQRISDGVYLAGRRLPSEQALAEEYGTTRARVRTALASLARRGLLVSRPNSGWLVHVADRAQTVGEMRAFSRWAAEQGRESSGLIVRRERGGATAREARLLGIGLGQEVLRFARVRRLEGRAVMVERSTWAPWVVPVIDAFPDDVSSVFGALDSAGVHVVLGDHRIEAVAASSDDALLLGVRRSSPLLQVSRTTSSRDGRMVEVAVDRYVSDVAAFDVRAGDVARMLLSPRD
jgi:GntR family transcriptional regulator